MKRLCVDRAEVFVEMWEELVYSVLKVAENALWADN